MRWCCAATLLAWIVWLHSVFANKDINEWREIGSAATLEDCRQVAATAASEAIKRFRAKNDGGTYVLEGLLIEVRFPSDEKASYAFVCLAENEDPRGPRTR